MTGRHRICRWFLVAFLCSIFGLLSLQYHVFTTSLPLDDDGVLRVVTEHPSKEFLIPHIIHQAWDSYNVPQELRAWIQSWKIHNPEWDYWLWTPDDVRALLSDKYPDYINLYNSYHYNIFRSDAMRYFVMDSFGGFYVDLDMECFKPLDAWTFDHQCLLSHETYAHPSLLFDKTDPNVMTTIMACRPGHPFFKHVIRDLPSSFKKYPTDVLNGTGPFFLDRNFRTYNQTGESFMTSVPGITRTAGPNSITVVPPEIFLPTFDPIYKEGLRKKCSKPSPKSQFAMRTCEKLRKTNFSNDISDMAYSNHYWVHMFLNEKTWGQKKFVSINELIPEAKTYRLYRIWGDITNKTQEQSFLDSVFSK